MTQIGEGQDTPGSIPQVLTFGAPTLGEILADRYRLEEHIGSDSLGRQLWRGIDVILRRPVAVVLRYPGGAAAEEMLSAAVTASRLVHPHLAGVYDAIDEGERAYVVREWVSGSSLREIVTAGGPLDVDRAVAITQAVAAAIAALHSTGMAHGNLHPGTVLVADDGRVVVTDARADEATTPEADIRAIGGVLYCALTAYWPHLEAGPTALPDAIRDSAGNPAAPRQVRGGVPTPLDELAVDLLRPTLTVHSAEILAAELGRFENAEGTPYSDRPSLDFDAFESSTFESAAEVAEPTRQTGRKIAIGVVGLLVIAIAGTLAATRVLGPGNAAKPGAVKATPAPVSVPSGKPTRLALAPDRVRIVDGKGGDRTELDGAEKVVDGNVNTGWKTDHYKRQAEFGGKKPGMGIFVDLGESRHVTSVQVQLLRQGATLDLRAGAEDPGTGADGDTKIYETYQRIGDPRADSPANVFLPGSPDQPTRYLLIWISKLPADGDEYQVGVQEISVFVE